MIARAFILGCLIAGPAVAGERPPAVSRETAPCEDIRAAVALAGGLKAVEKLIRERAKPGEAKLAEEIRRRCSLR